MFHNYNRDGLDYVLTDKKYYILLHSCN